MREEDPFPSRLGSGKDRPPLQETEDDLLLPFEEELHP
jgi:hypothetical protein